MVELKYPLEGIILYDKIYRPGVSEADLQTALPLIDYLIIFQNKS